MQSNRRRIAVIGAGASGLIAIKCLKEVGLEPVCFEKTKYIGGLWRYHDDDIQGISSVPWYTFMDHSKEMWAFSDFPPKKELPNFVRHTEVFTYLAEFIQHFNLLEHMNFQKDVVKVMKSSDFETSGKWLLKIMDTETQEIVEEVFDGVLVCSGHLCDPHVPSFPGKDKFQGKIMHTHSLKKIDAFTDKKVVVIGSGSAGLDAAVEISNVAKQVYLSSRSGVHAVPRLSPKGLPNDTGLIRQWNKSLCNIQRKVHPSGSSVSQVLDHELYNLETNQAHANRNPVINDLIAFKISMGTVILKKKVKEFVQNGIFFEDDPSNCVEVDTVVLATGYNWKFPFLENGILEVNGKRIDLYKCVFPPQLKHETLAFIGFIKPMGPDFPTFEMQSRWASMVLAGKVSLPSKRSMLVDIALQYDRNCKNFPVNPWVFLKTDYISYMQDISSKIGVQPNLLNMLVWDRKLLYAYYFGPAVSYLYRLEGPNAWAKARDTILHTYARITFPIHGHRPMHKTIKGSQRHATKMFVLLNVALITGLVLTFLRMVKRNSKLRYYLIFKLFPYVNMVQQLMYGS